jgi:hypothetical protein
MLCAQAWRNTAASAAGLATTLEQTAGGRNLLAIGQQDDLRLAADVDRFDVVPWLDRARWRVCLPSP